MSEKEIIKQFDELSDEDIKLITELDLSKYSSFKQSLTDLPYQEFSLAFSKATPRQRGYIHGLSDKLSIDEYGSLPYYISDIRDLSLFHAAHVIEILLCLKEAQEGSSIF